MKANPVGKEYGTAYEHEDHEEHALEKELNEELVCCFVDPPAQGQ